MFCVKCGKENMSKAKFCKYCGNELVTYSELNKFQNKRKNLIILGIVGVTSALIIVGVSYMLGRDKDTTSFTAIEETKPEERPVSEETESSDDKTINNDLENELGDKVEDILVGDILVEEEPQLKREETICHLYHIYDEVMYEGYEINEYDENGNIIYTETDYITWNFEYDFRPDGTCSAQYTYNSAGDRIYEIYYDEHGNITKEECPDSEFDAYVYLLAYDEKGNMIKKITCWYLPTEPEKLYSYETLVLSYDEKGRLLTETIHYDGFDEMPTRIYVNEYDESNNLILRYARDDSLPEGMSYKEEYDPATYTRKIYSYSSGALRLFEYVQYNENGDMLSKVNYDAEGNVVEQYQYRYEDMSDYKGNVIERTIYVNEELFLTIKREYYQ